MTAADRGAEAAIRQILAHEFPDHGIVGEEFPNVNEDADYVWTIDPIDGTRAFILGFPMWGTLIGLRYQGQAVLGIMDQPFIGERFWNDDRAAWYRGPRGGIVRCQTRACTDLSQAFLTASSPDMFKAEEEARFNRLAKAVRMRRFGGDCYAYCMVALGQIDIVAEASLKPFDIAPLIPILEKAGAVVKKLGWRRCLCGRNSRGMWASPAFAGGSCSACCFRMIAGECHGRQDTAIHLPEACPIIATQRDGLIVDGLCQARP